MPQVPGSSIPARSNVPSDLAQVQSWRYPRRVVGISSWPRWRPSWSIASATWRSACVDADDDLRCGSGHCGEAPSVTDGSTTGRDGGQDTDGVAREAPMRSRLPGRSVHVCGGARPTDQSTGTWSVRRSARPDAHPDLTVSGRRQDGGMESLRISCDDCSMRHSAACEDCVVTFICSLDAGDVWSSSISTSTGVAPPLPPDSCPRSATALQADRPTPYP